MASRRYGGAAPQRRWQGLPTLFESGETCHGRGPVARPAGTGGHGARCAAARRPGGRRGGPEGRGTAAGTRRGRHRGSPLPRHEALAMSTTVAPLGLVEEAVDDGEGGGDV